MAISVYSGLPRVRLPDSATAPLKRTWTQAPATNAPASPRRATRSDRAVGHAQLLVALLAQLAAAGKDPRDHPAFAILETLKQNADVEMMASPLFWRDAPPEVLAAAQDGGRQMMTSLLAIYAR
ncbi:hypothetical protein [Qipengyuania qiaonensis]|uniref:Uncharacterized protein n=1 Tax=Qipengyuania qiaonensis TaxID=2867240 RepID=A0ABS7J5W9_9SPHN|nr:hypothetical protein [Qipengyuania qiaonensis]MBX7482723.1 hypothetical protein [Qipengyuania qiaonensis]